MTLTEQWKKGELEIGYYYIKGADGFYGIMSDYELYRVNLEHPDNTISLLAEVPSYEEWRRTFHYAGKYEHEYTSCVMDYENLKQENQQLKELLKECEDVLLSYSNISGDYELYDKITNAIGENK